MAPTTIQNPGIPFVTSISGGKLHHDNFIIIQGEPWARCHRFTVNLLNGSTMKCVFHFDVRFDQGEIVRNTDYPSGWGPEERSPLYLQRGRKFHLELRCSGDRYLVALDGRHYCEYIHRVSNTLADTLQILGDVRVSKVQFQSSSFHPPTHPPAYQPGYPPAYQPGYPPTQPSAPIYNHNRLNVVNPPIPFSSLMNGNLGIGGEIQVHGRVPPRPNRFHVNLQQGSQTYPHPIVAFHFNPRFEGGNRVIVMNSYQRLFKWGTEERVSGYSNPFTPNGHFVLIIRCLSTCYEVLVNGSRICTFNHRMSADKVDAVAIEGDVFVDRVVAL